MKYLREKISKFANDKYGMLIFMSWIILIACLVVKMFGGNWFELSMENSKFIEFCLYVDEHMWLKAILACVLALIGNYFTLCIMLNEKKLSFKNIIIFFPIMIIKSFISWYNSNISLVLDIFIMLVLTTIINKNFVKNIICFITILAFQIITILFRNLSFNFNMGNTFVEQSLYQIDYYLMILLFYLYYFRKKKEEE